MNDNIMFFRTTFKCMTSVVSKNCKKMSKSLSYHEFNQRMDYKLFKNAKFFF